jgi:tetratricopeptide (TPR) repeat protein
VLDGAIWKLRDGRVARILLRTRDPAPAAEGAQERASPWPARLLWGTGALCAAVLFGATWETHFGLYRAFERGELARAQLAAARLAWVGRDSADVRISLGRALRRNGDLAGALGEFGRSLELRPSAAAWTAIGDLHTGREEWELSASAYESALALDPELETVQYGLGLARLRLGQPRRARDAFARAVALNPERKINRVMLERAEQMIREESPAAG